MGRKLIDQTGNRYGSLTVLSLTKDKNNRTAWLCKCDCGNIKIVRGSDLRGNRITSCGLQCPLKKNGRFIDQTGNKYGSLTVLYKTAQRSLSQKTLWHCKCDCGNEIDVLGESLRQGLTKSCGCNTNFLKSYSNIKRLENQNFGYLTVKSFSHIDPKFHNAIWNCTCKCGKEIQASTNQLSSGRVQSCGCKKESNGEIFVKQILEKRKIVFKQEYSFSNLVNPKTNRKLRYDFTIFDNNQNLKGLIEYNGRQHYIAVDYFGGKEAFQQRKILDKIKKEYAEKISIPLLILKHSDKNNDIKINNFLQEIKLI